MISSAPRAIRLTAAVALRADLGLNDCAHVANVLYFSDKRPSFTDAELFSILHLKAAKAMKAVRVKRPERFPHNITTAFLFASVLADRRVLNVEQAMWEAYPGECTYCHTAPCSCNQTNRPEERTATKKRRRCTRPRTVREFQKLSADIYPPQNDLDTLVHLAEEFAELGAAFHLNGKLTGLSRRGAHAAFKDPFEIEVIDVMSHLFKIATSQRFDLENAILDRQISGCHQCRATKCACTVLDFLDDAHK
ncbi:MAG TPA: hypothetical protein VF438_03115 [Candidatus Paceibacterota bacterium]